MVKENREIINHDVRDGWTNRLRNINFLHTLRLYKFILYEE